MDIEEIKKLAVTSPEMPSGLTMAEQEAFMAIGFLLAQWRAGAVSAEYTKSAYADISRAFRRAKSGEDLVEWFAGLRKRIEAAMNAYRLDRTLENADRLVGVIDGFIREEGTQ